MVLFILAGVCILLGLWLRFGLLGYRFSSLICFALAGLFACWAGVYALCLLMEWLRTKLFALLRVPALCSRLETLLFRGVQRSFPDA